MAENGFIATVTNWGTATKTARPANVGPHDYAKDQHDPANRGFTPEEGYKPGPGDNNNRTDADAPGGPVNIGLKGADGTAPGQPGKSAAPDDGITDETRAKTSRKGKAGI